MSAATCHGVSSRVLLRRVAEWTSATHCYAQVGHNYVAVWLLASHNLAPLPFMVVPAEEETDLGGSVASREESDTGCSPVLEHVAPITTELVVYSPCCGRLALVPTEVRATLADATSTEALETVHALVTRCHEQQCMWRVAAHEQLLGHRITAGLTNSFAFAMLCAAVPVAVASEPGRASAPTAAFLLPRRSGPRALQRRCRLLQPGYLQALTDAAVQSGREESCDLRHLRERMTRNRPGHNTHPTMAMPPREFTAPENHPLNAQLLAWLIVLAGFDVMGDSTVGNTAGASGDSASGSCVGAFLALDGATVAKAASSLANGTNFPVSPAGTRRARVRAMIHSVFDHQTGARDEASNSEGDGALQARVATVVDRLARIVCGADGEATPSSWIRTVSLEARLDALDRVEGSGDAGEPAAGAHSAPPDIRCRAPFQCRYCGFPPLVEVESSAAEVAAGGCTDSTPVSGDDANTASPGPEEHRGGQQTTERIALVLRFGTSSHSVGCPWKVQFLDRVYATEATSSMKEDPTAVVRVSLTPTAFAPFSNLSRGKWLLRVAGRSKAASAAESSPMIEPVAVDSVIVEFPEKMATALLHTWELSCDAEGGLRPSGFETDGIAFGATPARTLTALAYLRYNVTEVVTATLLKPLSARTEQLITDFESRKRQREEYGGDDGKAPGRTDPQRPSLPAVCGPAGSEASLAAALSSSPGAGGSATDSLLRAYSLAARTSTARSLSASDNEAETTAWRKAYTSLRRCLSADEAHDKVEAEPAARAPSAPLRAACEAYRHALQLSQSSHRSQPPALEAVMRSGVTGSQQQLLHRFLLAATEGPEGVEVPPSDSDMTALNSFLAEVDKCVGDLAAEKQPATPGKLPPPPHQPERQAPAPRAEPQGASTQSWSAVAGTKPQLPAPSTSGKTWGGQAANVHRRDVSPRAKGVRPNAPSIQGGWHVPPQAVMGQQVGPRAVAAFPPQRQPPLQQQQQQQVQGSSGGGGRKRRSGGRGGRGGAGGQHNNPPNRRGGAGGVV